MKILITGVAGFVGSTLAEKFIDQKYEVIGIDNLHFGYESRLAGIKDKAYIIYDDVRNLESYIEKEAFDSIDVIIHCAAIAPLPENQKNLYASLSENVALCGSVADFATKAGIKNIIFFSSGAVYEGSGYNKCIENSIVDPKLIYPLSKALAERVFDALSSTYNINVIVLRLFNLYGPKQDYSRKQPPLIGYLIKSILNSDPVTLFASPNAKRDYIFIDDLYELVFKSLTSLMEERLSGFNIFNAGSGSIYSVYEIYEKLCSIYGVDATYKIGEKVSFWNSYPEIFNRKMPLNSYYLQSEVDKVAIADIEKSKSEFNWSPSYSMDEGLVKCLDFAKKVIK